MVVWRKLKSMRQLETIRLSCVSLFKLLLNSPSPCSLLTEQCISSLSLPFQLIPRKDLLWSLSAKFQITVCLVCVRLIECVCMCVCVFLCVRVCVCGILKYLVYGLMEGWDIKNRAWVLVRAAYKIVETNRVKKRSINDRIESKSNLYLQ